MNSEQLAWCEQIVAELERVFPDYPRGSFTSNAASSTLGSLLQISMPASVARELLDAFVRPPA